MKNRLIVKVRQKVKKILQKLSTLEKNVRKNNFLPSIDKIFIGPKGISVNEANFLYLFTKMCQPQLVLETGTCCGYSTAFIAAALAENRVGHCYTCEINPDNYKNAEINFKNLGLKKWITICRGSSIEIIKKLIKENKISFNLDLVYLDSGTHVTIQEFELLKDHVRPGSGYVICHDVFLPKESGKGVVLYPYIRDKYQKYWDLCVLKTGGPGFIIARKKGTQGCDTYKSLESYDIKDFQDFLANWLPRIVPLESNIL